MKCRWRVAGLLVALAAAPGARAQEFDQAMRAAQKMLDAQRRRLEQSLPWGLRPVQPLLPGLPALATCERIREHFLILQILQILNLHPGPSPAEAALGPGFDAALSALAEAAGIPLPGFCPAVIVSDQEINAGVAPANTSISSNKYVEFHLGLLTRLPEEDEFAAALAHELGHLLALPFSYALEGTQESEIKADLYALAVLAHAGYDPRALIRLHERVLAEEGEIPGVRARIAAARGRVDEFQPSARRPPDLGWESLRREARRALKTQDEGRFGRAGTDLRR